MHFDFSTLDERQISKLLLGTVVPRPIALVTTIDTVGRRNAAPFSFFNCMSSAPPLLVIGLENRGPGTRKDTHDNICATREFAVHLVDEALCERMNIMATDFEPGIDELAEAGVETREAVSIGASLIVDAPVCFECRLEQSVDLGDGRSIEIGRVLHMHARDGLINPNNCHVDATALQLVARMQNPGWYSRTTDTFQMRRLSPSQWAARKAASTGDEPQ